jgi:CRP/FNR family cyclic AMP-dependent transcriptional regulator
MIDRTGSVQAVRDPGTPEVATRGALVLDLDREMGAGLPSADRKTARDACRGTLLHVSPGPLELSNYATSSDVPMAFVIIDGMLCREVALRDSHMLELLGPGDVIQHIAASNHDRLGGSVRLTAVTDAQLIALGQSYLRAATRWPALLGSLLERLEAQRARLAIQGLIAHIPRAEHRLLLVLWHLSALWGRVTPEGTVLSVPLTHKILAHLVAARRSTVTLAARALAEENYIRRLDDRSWLLTNAAKRKLDSVARTSENGGRAIAETLLMSIETVAGRNTDKRRARNTEPRQPANNG